MIVKSKKLISCIILLSILNIWLLYTNYVRQNQIDYFLNIERKPSTTKVESERWGFEQKGDRTANIIHPEVNISDRDISMAVFFTDSGCSYCVDHEVKLLNNLYDKFNGKFKVYLLSHNESFLDRLYEADFAYATIDPRKKLLDNDFDFANPVALLFDRNGVVQISHIAEKDNENKSNEFYKTISSLLLSIKH